MADKFLCDIHSHVLPGLDDGCRSVEESLSQLKNCGQQGIQRIFFTPHYYHRESISDFLTKRNLAWKTLHEAMDLEGGSFPEVRLGAEVAFFRSISYEEDLPLLCLGNSNYLLLEMPFQYWTPSIITELQSLISVSGLTIIIAHLERYLKSQDKDSLQALFHTGAMIQMNAEYILAHPHKAKKMIRDGIVSVLGSDCHNLTNRVQNLAPACNILIKSGLQNRLSEMMDTSNYIFEKGQLSC